jgi:hypothetical protein
MPNFKAEYTLEMVLDLIEADLNKEGFDLSGGVTFNLVDFNKSTLQLDIVKADRNAIPSFLSTLLPETQQALLGPAPEPETKPGKKSTATEFGVAKNGKPYKKPPSEKELARRANLSLIVKKRRAEEKAAKEAAKAALVPIPVPVQEPEAEPEPLPVPQDDRELRDPADYLLPEEKRFYRKVEQTERQQIFEQRMKELNGGVEVVAPAPATFPRSR